MSQNEPIDIYHNPSPGSLPPPWYRPPPGVTTGPRRIRACILGGLLVDNDEGRRWFKDKYGYELADHHRQDVNVNMRLKKLFVELEIDAFDCRTAPRRLESAVSDFLIVTRIKPGPFIHSGPEQYEEVYEEDRKLVPGDLEVGTAKQLMEKLQLKTCGFKCYYSNAQYVFCE